MAIEAELKINLPFDINLSKILLDLLRLRTKAKKPAIQF